MSDTPGSGITYDHHSDDSKGIIYDRNMFIVQATGVRYLSLYKHFQYATVTRGLVSRPGKLEIK